MSANRHWAGSARAAKGMLSIAVLCTSTFAHVATYFGHVVVDGIWALILHGMVLAVFGFGLGHLVAQMPPSPGAIKLRLSVPWSVINDGMPRWAIRLLRVTFAYTILNFAIFLILTSDADAERRGGKCVLASRGQAQRVVSDAECERYRRLRNARGRSGHWILFSLLPVLIFVVRRPAANARE